MQRVQRKGTKPIKTCACGRSYTRAQWEALRFVGRGGDEVESLELRDCAACGSTIAIGRARVIVLYSVEELEGGGWILFRRAGGDEPIAFGIGSRATIFSTKASATRMIGPQRRFDRAAATRLNVELVDGGDGEL